MYSSYELLTLKSSVCTEQFSNDDIIYSYDKQSKNRYQRQGLFFLKNNSYIFSVTLQALMMILIF